jgi:hypothetical protein
MNDTLAVSKVAAEFSYLDDFLKNSEILTINGQDVDQYDLSGGDDALTVVRKEYGKQHWLVLGVSKDFVTRDNTININNNPVDIVISPAGNLYEIAFVSENGEILEDGRLDGELKIRLIDDAKTFSLMSEADESLFIMKQFGDFSTPIVNPTSEPTSESTPDPASDTDPNSDTDPTTLPTPIEPANKGCKEVSFINLRSDILESSYNNFVLSQVKQSKVRRKKQLKNAKKLIAIFNDDISHLPESVKICPNQQHTELEKFETVFENARLHLREIYNLSSGVIKQQRKKKRKINNRKNKDYYNKKRSLLVQYQNS